VVRESKKEKDVAAMDDVDKESPPPRENPYLHSKPNSVLS
jgi:hypothetical protein